MDQTDRQTNRQTHRETQTQTHTLQKMYLRNKKQIKDGPNWLK